MLTTVTQRRLASEKSRNILLNWPFNTKFSDKHVINFFFKSKKRNVHHKMY